MTVTEEHNIGIVRCVDWQPGNSTRYLCIAARCPPGVASGDNPVWCVSFPLIHGTSYLVHENSAVSAGYVADKWQVHNATDAKEMALAIAEAVPGVRCVR